MYLVLAQLHAPPRSVMPPGAAGLFRCCARPADGLEHLTLRPDGASGPAVGLFLTASGLALAELAALAVCRRALATHPELAPFTVLSCGAALVPAYYDGLLAGAGGGRIVPRQNPSNRSPFHPF
ncbi:hypothetical protein ACIRBX_05705 [Kitasatospora sp. NPDC096147]|uniref:hypothetical protein n=1 Tax=Kitasatospora sp. NPDC096147 TaxID=3364093 RepID=UPI00382DA731